ncbi:CocE/NonD family hydrolase [Rodentibacter myodis]|uniref:Antibiotic hydrolase n=1 Tax=Rodentibacter myodis TaxID=1907939 RepID=A0A1V3JL26_9PAST|nr:CocE/NonD family hydrolase [Rodentibacter myodis]OOF57338.1 antibiotic hydrolase [Rodentibacter myodis]
MSYTLLRDIMIPMRDGIFLATDIYLPNQSLLKSWPVVIERTPYNKSAHSRSEIQLDGKKISREKMAKAFTQREMVVVFQDCRGRYNSEGTFTKYINEGEDGFDTYRWIMAQPWCNGNIGSMGLSYAAHTQLAAACLNPEGLKTMVLDSGGFSNAYQCGIRQGGAFELKQATWAFRQAAQSPMAKSDPLIASAIAQENIHQWFEQMPWKSGCSPIRYIPEYEDYLLQQWRKGEFDEYWQQLGIYAEKWYKTLPDIPVLFMSSWYDAYVPSTIANFMAFSKKGRKAPQRLIMGPWLHGDRNITYSGDVEFSSKAAFDGNIADNWLGYRLDWFEKYLKLPVDQNEKHNISFFMMGGGNGRKDSEGRMQHGGQWIHSNSYPFPKTETQIWFLQHDFGLKQVPSKEKIHIFQSDPNNPVPTIGGAITSGKPIFWGGAFDQRELPGFYGSKQNNMPLNARKDILSYQSDILEHDLCLAGEVKIRLFFESDAPDCDFTAKLIDVYPPNEDYPQGYAMNITDGIIRCRYRNSWTTPTLLETGKIEEVIIRPFESCNLFKKGHRLRIDISGSNFPHFDCNPNSGEPEGYANIKRIATNKIYVGKLYASALEIQVIKINT